MERKIRYNKIDDIRGLALLCMIAYHTLWDLVYIFGVNMPWYRSTGAYVWQQSICWTFIFISGFCQPLGKKKLKRSLLVFGAGLLITAVTVIFMPQDRVVFGVLTLLGSCMLIFIPLEKLMKKINCIIGAGVSILLFFLTRNINEGYLGFEQFNIMKLPDFLYSNLFTTWLGFTEKKFYSTDYFSLFPWIFLFFTGYFCFRIFEKYNLLKIFEKKLCKPLEWLGKHSLIIYVLHQPLVYAILTCVFAVI